MLKMIPAILILSLIPIAIADECYNPYYLLTFNQKESIHFDKLDPVQDQRSIIIK
jgi:hypothetical protein